MPPRRRGRPSPSPNAARRAVSLLDRHFEGVSAAQFDQDLDEKDWVLRIRRDGGLVGFTTLQLYRAQHAGRGINVIYSGDTIMAPEAWGSPVLARGWIALVRALQASRPGEPWYWLLLSSGFRTYRFLPVFWREFWPRHDAEPPAEVQSLLAALALDRFGAAYDAGAGVVRFAHPQRLRGTLAAVPVGRDDDPHVRFFLARNAGHASGDELVCLTELSDDNLTAAGVRMVRGTRTAATPRPAP
ncbi:MAG: hypothetical protein IPF87_07395 [Gemmatimonadetes bacterium]|nr:hypothetical protein [Gemmatimonadota bacterium]